MERDGQQSNQVKQVVAEQYLSVVAAAAVLMYMSQKDRSFRLEFVAVVCVHAWPRRSLSAPACETRATRELLLLPKATTTTTTTQVWKREPVGAS